MSATLLFVDSTNQLIAPWKCHCVLPLSSDPYGLTENCDCEDRDCNMSNRNCRIVLSALGLSTDFENDPIMLPQELHAACQRYLASDMADLVDNGRETVVDGNMIECGLDAGYVTGRIVQIKSLCEAAMLDGAMRCYFC